jgi:prepilin-type N-terminal cleavage/methylation domain-containing protein
MRHGLAISPRRGTRRGFTLIEVLVALAILLAGLVAITQLFPVSLRASADAALQGEAVFLAQQKVDELRRDRDQLANIIQHIQDLTEPTQPIVFPHQPRLTYSYSGQSVLYPEFDPADPRTFPNVARVIIRKRGYATPDLTDPDYEPGDELIGPALYELRFDI